VCAVCPWIHRPPEKNKIFTIKSYKRLPLKQFDFLIPQLCTATATPAMPRSKKRSALRWNFPMGEAGAGAAGAGGAGAGARDQGVLGRNSDHSSLALLKQS